MEEQKTRLNGLIQQAKDEVAAGLTLTPEQARAQTRKHLQTLKERQVNETNPEQ